MEEGVEHYGFLGHKHCGWQRGGLQTFMSFALVRHMENRNKYLDQDLDRDLVIVRRKVAEVGPTEKVSNLTIQNDDG
jgi:hypothetical protein